MHPLDVEFVSSNHWLVGNKTAGPCPPPSPPTTLIFFLIQMLFLLFSPPSLKQRLRFHLAEKKSGNKSLEHVASASPREGPRNVDDGEEGQEAVHQLACW